MTEPTQEALRWTAKGAQRWPFKSCEERPQWLKLLALTISPSDIEHWQETFLAAGENGLKSRPKEKLERKDQEIQKLKQKVGELVMDLDILQEVHQRAKLDPFSSGWSSDD